MMLIIVTISWCGCITLPRDPSPRVEPNAAESNGRGRINVNTASAADLEKLPGIGKVVAERIVSHRQQFGAFRRAEHLMMVRGISDQKFRAIRSSITVE